MFNGAPILLGPRCDLGAKGQNAIHIGTIFAVHLFDKVEIAKLMPIE
jgi:hypothetical protein